MWGQGNIAWGRGAGGPAARHHVSALLPPAYQAGVEHTYSCCATANSRMAKPCMAPLPSWHANPLAPETRQP